MMSEELKGGRRSKNFTEIEEFALLELVQEKKDVFENKKSDAATWKQKEQAWEKLADEYYSKTGVRREWKHLRDKYMHLKYRSKKVQRHHRGTGRTAKAKFSRVSEKINTMMGDSAIDQRSSDDSDACIVKNEPIPMTETDIQLDLDDANNTLLEDDIPSTSSRCSTILRLPMTTTKLMTEVSPAGTLEVEKIKLVQIQQHFFACENQRAQEKHESEMFERKAKVDDEARQRKLRIELLELEVKEKKAKLNC